MEEVGGAQLATAKGGNATLFDRPSPVSSRYSSSCSRRRCLSACAVSDTVGSSTATFVIVAEIDLSSFSFCLFRLSTFQQGRADHVSTIEHKESWESENSTKKKVRMSLGQRFEARAEVESKASGSSFPVPPPISLACVAFVAFLERTTHQAIPSRNPPPFPALPRASPSPSSRSKLHHVVRSLSSLSEPPEPC